MNDEERRNQLRERKFVTPAEGAFLIRRDKRTVNRWIEAGLVVTYIGRERYVAKVELLRWAADPDRRTRRRRELPK